MWGSCGRHCPCDWIWVVPAAVLPSDTGRRNWPLCCHRNHWTHHRGNNRPPFWWRAKYYKRQVFLWTNIKYSWHVRPLCCSVDENSSCFGTLHTGACKILRHMMTDWYLVEKKTWLLLPELYLPQQEQICKSLNTGSYKTATCFKSKPIKGRGKKMN